MYNLSMLWMLFYLGLERACAQIQTYTPPGQNAITYSVNIPQSTSATGSGPIFIQMKAAQEVQWFAWGQGSGMQGANIFVVYAATENNLTVSPRLGVAHVEPLFNPDTQFSILNGSGIEDGVMTVNLRCDTCVDWPGGHEDVTSTSSPWIWAIKYGSLFDSSSQTAAITVHDISGLASLNLKQATGGDTANPFLEEAPSVSTGAPQAVSTFNSQSIQNKRIAHAVIMIVTFVVLFPLFALGLRLFPSPSTVKFHACFQVFALALAITGLGLGISMATTLRLTGYYHPIIGIITVSCLIVFQPIMGLFQHWYYRRTGEKSAAAYLHRWLGRVLITLGIINGGLGFRLIGIGTSMAPVGAVIAYSVVAGLVWVGYGLVVSFILYRRRQHQP